MTDLELKFNEEIFNRIEDAKIDDEESIDFEVKSIIDLADTLNQVQRYMENNDQLALDYENCDFGVTGVTLDLENDKIYLNFEEVK
jgi:hypothetical protein